MQRLTNPINSWSVPTLNLKKELLDPNENFSEKPYSILDLRYVFRDANELSELLQVYPHFSSHDVDKLVAFRPERITLHELIAAITLSIKFEDEIELQALVHQLYKDLQAPSSYQNIIKKAYEQRELIHKLTLDQLNGSRCEDLIQSAIANKINDLKPLLSKNEITFGIYVKGYTNQDALVALTVDAIYKELIIPEIHKFIDEFLKSVTAHKKDSGLSEIKSHKRLTVMIAGGQASGKTWAYTLLQPFLQNKHLSLRDYAKLNTDHFKPLVIQPGSVNKYIYSQLAQPEATHIRRTIQTYLKRKIQDGVAPNLCIDQVFLDEKKINFSFRGKGIIAIIISTPVEIAMERSFERGNKAENNQGRFENTCGVLVGHRDLVIKFLANIFNYVGNNLRVIIYENTAASDVSPYEVMQIDHRKRIVTIFNIDKFKSFIKKIAININANCKEDVYVENHQELVETAFKQFLDKLKEYDYILFDKSQKDCSLPLAFLSCKKSRQYLASSEPTQEKTEVITNQSKFFA